jgi:ParB family transcriptional regulator, chromosome partitioning protein
LPITEFIYNNMTKLPEGKNRLDLVREGLGDAGLKKKGRLVVGIDRLREDPKNERRTFRNMDGLIASIRGVGLIEPITVTAETDGQTFQIITGHRRFRAAKAAGLQQVEVLIREPEDEVTRRVKSIISNVQREDVGPVDLAEALQSLLDEDEQIRSQDDLAKTIGKDKTWVSGMLRILTLPTGLQEKVGSTQLSVPYDAMIRIARLENHSHQAELVERLIGGATQREIRDRIDELKGKSKAPATTEAMPKPKRVYRTAHHATVIVQGTHSRLGNDEVIAALKEALDIARAS